jgi:Protein of unknown function (DUF2946)
MKYLRSERGIWAFALAIFSIYLQILLPLGQAFAASQADDDGFSNQIIICTLYGPKLIYDAQGKEVPPEEGGMIECPVCVTYAIGNAALVSSAEIILPIPSAVIVKSISVVDVIPGGFTAPSAYLTRAPPVYA